jgi:hypothetical protein
MTRGQGHCWGEIVAAEFNSLALNLPEVDAKEMSVIRAEESHHELVAHCNLLGQHNRV